MSTVGERLQVVAVRGVVAALRMLPWRAASAFGGWLGRLGYAPLGIRRRVVDRQVAAAFPALAPHEVARIARGAYESLGRTTIEAALLASLGGRGILDLFAEVEGWEHVEAAMALGRGVVLVTGHLGNWELSGAYLAARGVPLDAIYFPAANKAFDAYMQETRQRVGMRIVTVWDTTREVPRALRAGRVVAFLADQALIGLSAAAVTFFGRPAFTPRGPAVFALRAGAPILFAVGVRRRDGRFRLVVEPIAVEPTGDKDADVQRIVEAFTAALERRIRETPAQYFWHHKRWKRQPEGTPEALRDPTR